MPAAGSGWHRRTHNTPAIQARARQYASKEHRTLKAAGQQQVDAGTAYCWRCGRWIPPGTTFHLGHDDNDRTVYRGPEHAACNLTAAARKGGRMQAARRHNGWKPSPTWHSRVW